MTNRNKILFVLICSFLTISGIEAQVRFIWPLKQARGFTDPGYYYIGNYTDHSTRSGILKDYNGGHRTYAGHRGTDIALYPDKWRKKWAGQVDVVAAAAGVIDTIVDGYNDNNCSLGGLPSNQIRLIHVDGSETTYKHLKKNALTSKQKGDWVAEGEFLGKVASSGNSTAPHLHFHVRDPQGNAVDPFVGPHNPTTNVSLWKNQLPYYDGGINKVYIGSDYASPPAINCFSFMNLNAQSIFQPGQRVYTSTYIRTPAPNSLINIYVFRPDGTLHNNNTVLNVYPLETPANKGKNRTSNLYRSYNLPFNAQIGTWTVIVTYNNLLSNADIVTFEVEPNNILINFKPTEINSLIINTTEPVREGAEKINLQRSYDGENWTTIDSEIDPEDIANWEYEDLEAALSETIYYRLNSLNIDGKETKGAVFYWEEKSTKTVKPSTGFLEVSDLLIDLYPNPTRGALQLVTTNVEVNKKVEIVTLTGQVLGAFDWEEGNNVLKLQVDFLPAGIYAAHITSGGQKVTKPFVKSE